MEPLRATPWVLLGAGSALVGWAVASGGATLSLVLVVPVVTGRSAPLLGGTVLLVLGIFLLPLALWELRAPSHSSHRIAAVPASPSVGPPRAKGGFLLLGPVPVLFGHWGGVSRRTRWLLALVGAVLFFVFLALVVAFR